MKKTTLLGCLLAATGMLSGCGSLITESMGEKIFLHLSFPVDVDSVTNPIKLTKDEMRIYETLRDAKGATLIRESRKAEVQEFLEQNQKGMAMDPYDYLDLTMYLGAVKAAAKGPKSVRDVCLKGDGPACDKLVSETPSMQNLAAREWEKLILAGGIKLDEKHRQILENVGKETAK